MNTVNIVENKTETTQLLEEENTQSKKYTLFGMAMSLLRALGMAASATSVAMLKRNIPDFQLNILRYLPVWIMCVLVLLVKKQWPVIPKNKIAITLGICVVGFIQTVGFFLTVTLVSMSNLKSVFFTTKIFSGFFIFTFFLKEILDYKKVLFSILCIIGVILSIQPSFIFTWKKHEHRNETNNVPLNLTVTASGEEQYIVTSTMTTIGCILSVVIGMGSAVFITLLKKVPDLTKSSFLLPFWQVTFGIIISTVTMAIFETPVLPSDWNETILIVIHSLTYMFDAPTYMLSAKYTSGNSINIISSTLVVLMLIPQYTLLKHILPGNRNWIEVLGTVLVFIGATAGSIIELIKTQKK